MARKPTRCDWCKTRRVCEEAQVVMRGRGDMAPGGAIVYPVIFAREWKLCSQCKKSCEARLHTAFRDVPE